MTDWIFKLRASLKLPFITAIIPLQRSEHAEISDTSAKNIFLLSLLFLLLFLFLGSRLAYFWHRVGIEVAFSWHRVGLRLASCWHASGI